MLVCFIQHKFDYKTKNERQEERESELLVKLQAEFIVSLDVKG